MLNEFLSFLFICSSNIKPGCKLLLTGVIPINNGFLQLTHDNTQFQYGSNTFPRPRSAFRVNKMTRKEREKLD